MPSADGIVNYGVYGVIEELFIDGRAYPVEVMRMVSLPAEAPRLAVVSRQLNRAAMDLVRVCIQAVQYFTPEPHELWVVDNNSPRENVEWLRELPNVNLAFSRTDPRPPHAEDTGNAADPGAQLTWDSYSNAIALEIAVRLIDPRSAYFMSMHMDTMPCRSGWLSHLRSKIQGKVGASGVRLDKTRTPEGVLHVLGYVVDFQLFRRLGLDFLPELPAFDVGDRVTTRLRQEGYEVFACPNTLWEPELISTIPASSPLSTFHVDRSFDDEGNVIFLHLGRGVRKSLGVHQRGTTPEEWVRIASEELMV
jgi:hypothetical protein